MSDTEIQSKKQLALLTNEMIDNVISTSDEDILKEVKEDYGSSDYEANKMREIIAKMKIFAAIANKRI